MTCPTCKGTARAPYMAFNGVTQLFSHCEGCNGTGEVYDSSDDAADLINGYGEAA